MNNNIETLVTKPNEINKNMEALENLSNDFDTYLPKINKNQLISVLKQLGINTWRQPDVIYNKCKLM